MGMKNLNDRVLGKINGGAIDIMDLDLTPEDVIFIVPNDQRDHPETLLNNGNNCPSHHSSPLLSGPSQ